MEEVSIIQELVDTAGIWLFIVGIVLWAWREIHEVKQNQKFVVDVLNECLDHHKARTLKADDYQNVMMEKVNTINETSERLSKGVHTKLNEVGGQHTKQDILLSEILQLVKVMQQDQQFQKLSSLHSHHKKHDED